MQFAFFGLLTAILALKRPYLTLDLWVQRSPHDIGLSPTMWAGDRLTVGLRNRGGFSPRFNQFCHAPPRAISLNGNWTASGARKLDGCQHRKSEFSLWLPRTPRAQIVGCRWRPRYAGFRGIGEGVDGQKASLADACAAATSALC